MWRSSLGGRLRIDGEIFNGARRAVVHHRGHVAFCRAETCYLPLRIHSAEELRGPARQQAHRKTVKRELQSGPAGFQICFLARPATEKCLGSGFRRQSLEIAYLARGKKTP